MISLVLIGQLGESLGFLGTESYLLKRQLKKIVLFKYVVIVKARIAVGLGRGRSYDGEEA